LKIARKLDLLMLVPFHQGFLDTAAEPLAEASLIIHALIVYGLRGDPRGTTSDLIEVANGSRAPVLTLDVPSGLDATTGRIHQPCIEVEWTLTLALPKTGLLTKEAKGVVGKLFLGDIGISREIYSEIGGEWVFLGDDLVRIVD
jgi:NAD(P)H-hydrate epimerase